MKTICTMARKGGAGKTTLAVSLALMWHARGSKVLVLDSDPQRSAWLYLNGNSQAGPDIQAVAAGKLFATKLAAARQGYDIVVIDTPAHPETDVSAALNVSDFVLVVARPTYLDLAASVQAICHLRQINRPGAIILNQAPPQRFGEDAPQVRKAKKALTETKLPLLGVLCARRIYQEGLEPGRSAFASAANHATTELSLLFTRVCAELGLADNSPPGQMACTAPPPPDSRKTDGLGQRKTDTRSVVEFAQRESQVAGTLAMAVGAP